MLGYVDYSDVPLRGHRLLLLTPWTFLRTSPGWSSMVDGLDGGGLAGWRGVIATDKFVTLSTILEMRDHDRFTRRRGAPLLRALPIPRDLLDAKATFEQA
jgi:hypothetical protein